MLLEVAARAGFVGRGPVGADLLERLRLVHRRGHRAAELAQFAGPQRGVRICEQAQTRDRQSFFGFFVRRVVEELVGAEPPLGEGNSCELSEIAVATSTLIFLRIRSAV